MPSFLYPLIHYTPRPGRTPREDFFTEAFAGVMRLDPRILTRIVELAQDAAPSTELAAERWSLDPEVDYEISTQYVLPNGRRPDLVVLQHGDPRLLIENKMGAAFTYREGDETQPGEQVPHYIQEAKRWPECRVLLISLYPRRIGEHERGRYLGNLLWGDVYEALRTMEDMDDPRADILRREVVRLMEDLDMTMPAPFRLGDSKVYYSYKSLMDRFVHLLDAVIVKIAQEFGTDSSGTGSTARWYVDRCLTTNNPKITIGLMFSDKSDTNLPILPYLFVRASDDQQTTQAIEVLHLKNQESKYTNFPGYLTFPNEEQLKKFHNARQWKEQVDVAYEIWCAWLEKLKEKDLL
jgi:hypothetical protein